MTLADIRTAVRDDIEESAAAFWSNALLDRYINRAIKYVRSRISQLGEQFFEREVEMTYTGNSREVSFEAMGVTPEPLKVIFMGQVVAGQEDRAIQMQHVDYVDEGHYRLRSGTVIDATSFRDQVYFLSGGVGGARTVGIRPIPNQNITIRMKYIPMAVDLNNDLAEPDIPQDFHECVVLYAVYLGKLREEAPARDHIDLFNETMQNAVWTLDARHEDNHPRVRTHDPTLLEYDW